MYTLKKSLGQHFLKDENICRKIVQELQGRPFTQLLEVGPGGGALTKYLIEIPDIAFRAVELDREKVDYLLMTYPSLKGRILEGSILDIPAPFSGNFTVVGNFPYNISTQILFRILEWREQVEGVIGMFQKEVALRVAAKEGSKVYGVTSVLVQAFYKVEYLFDVHENCFQPPPKVKSAVIRLSPLENPPAIASPGSLFRLVKAAFNQRRKTLRNATKDCFVKEILDLPIFDRRAEQLSVAEFAELTFKMKE
ncbi:MAG: 16S rRNA (adenine(1518)-N(6)/adenine(1519)-N(6))-dimethyltransferase RsmA [Chitinophagaceae bacterium]|nr:16S rRNA (adenine(1518)-N(6)/adenine(1519)-N(6))-dimethyltransferase RsmA [Chitinophagaceae bacterium]